MEEMRDEGIETASPGEPLMMGAGRNEVIDVDTHGFKVGGHLARTEVLLTSAAHKEVVHLTVKLLCSCKDTIETCLDINGKERTTEGTHIGEHVEMWQGDVTGLIDAP